VARQRVRVDSTRAPERHDDALDVRGDASVDKKTTRVESALGAVVRTFGLSGRLGGFIEDFLGSSSARARAAARFAPAEHGLPDVFRRAGEVAEVRVFDRPGQRPGELRVVLGDGARGGDVGQAVHPDGRRRSPRNCRRFSSGVRPRGYGASGCDGGESSVAYEYAMKTGVVTGGAFGDTNTCAPYPFEACDHPCSVFPTPQCPSTCVAETKEGSESGDAKSGDDVAAAALGGENGVSPALSGT